MVVVRSALKSLFRSPWKALLLTLLIAAGAVSLCLGTGLWSAVEKQLADCDTRYTTLAVVEYMGDAYPDAWQADAGLQTASTDFAASGAVWCDSGTYPVSLEGYKRYAGHVPQKKSAVLLLTNVFWLETHNLYVASMQKPLYCYEETDAMFLFLDAGAFSFEPAYFDVYAVHGTFMLGKTNYPYLQLTTFPEWLETDEPPIRNVTGEVDAFLTGESVFTRAARSYKLSNGALEAYEVDSWESLLLYHQGTVRLESGRLFEPDERDVCVTTTTVASALGLSVGDRVTLSQIELTGGGPDGALAPREFTVVGLMTAPEEARHTVYLPRGSFDSYTPERFGYTLATAVIPNGSGEAFRAAVEPLLGERETLSIYDQGYTVIAASLLRLRSTAQRLTLLGSAAALGICALYAYLAVLRQQDTAVVLRSLGVRRRERRLYLLGFAAVPALFGATLGGVAGVLLSGRVTALVQSAVSSTTAASLLYSDSVLGVILDYTASAISPDTRLCIAIPALVALTALIVCALFTIPVLRERQTHRRPRILRRDAALRVRRTGLRPGTPFGFALLSVCRGGWRTAVVPVVACTLCVFLCTLSALSASYSDNRAALDRNTVLTGDFMDTTGRRLGGLALATDKVTVLEDCEAIDEIRVSCSMHYFMQGVSQTADGRSLPIPDFYVPDPTSYAYETLMDTLARQPLVVFTNDFDSVAEFAYTSAEAEYADGWDESLFLLPKSELAPCLVSETFMVQWDIHYGDRLAIVLGGDLVKAEFVVAGSFRKAGEAENVYVPLQARYQRGLLAGQEETGTTLPFCGTQVYTSASFTLTSPAQLSTARAFLEKRGYGGVGWLGENRLTVLLHDREYLSRRDTLDRQIRYMELLTPLIYAFSLLLGFFTAWLMLQSRRSELSVMRVLGASKTRVFLAFFLEHTLLCLVGTSAALLIRLPLGGLSGAQALSALGFLLCYLAGTALCVARMNAGCLLRALSDES